MVIINIFSALSQGKGRLNEENLTAMLGYLLNPKSEHGLSDLFLYRFLEAIGKESNKDFSQYISTDYSIDITFESPYEYNGKMRRVDIDLKIFKQGEECLRIIIENKIRASSADKYQFLEEYRGVCANLKEDALEGIEMVMVFITPSHEDIKLIEEYDALKSSNMAINHMKQWLYWNDNDSEDSITSILKQLLIDENRMLIHPITEYVRHTIKAFVFYIQENQNTISENMRHNPLEGDSQLGAFSLHIDDKEYQIEEYASSAIKVRDLEEDKYVSAKPILRKTIETLKMPIELKNKNGNFKNTRQLGKEILRFTDEVFLRAIKKDPSSVKIIESEDEIIND